MLTDCVVTMNWGGALMPHPKPRIVADGVSPLEKTPWIAGWGASWGLDPTVET